jgi:ribosome maturation factor RimP
MVSESTITALETILRSSLDGEPTYFLVELKLRPGNQVRIFLDGDQGITIEKCVQFNRSLYRLIDQAGIFPAGDFSLEVSSPGVDEPLKQLRQYRKNVGRRVEVLLTDGTKKIGRLLETREDGIIVEESPARKPGGKAGWGAKPANGLPGINHHLPFDQIKTTIIQAVF